MYLFISILIFTQARFNIHQINSPSQPALGPMVLMPMPDPLACCQIFLPVLPIVLAYNVIVYINIDFYSCWFQYPSNKFSEPTGVRPDGSDADAKPLCMLLNILPHCSDGVSVQCNCV
jgi:hypothetical protein